MNDKQRTSLSKLMALLLRHRAKDYGLTLDPEGFVPVADLVAVIKKQHGWTWIERPQLEEIIATQQKRRYEIVGDDIRAIYGHSLEAAVQYEAITPPALLYHGTARRFVDTILRDGLKPMQRQYVHLTDDAALAMLTGKRRDANPAMLRIDAAHAHAAGIVFYRADDGIILAKEIPAECLVLNAEF